MWVDNLVVTTLIYNSQIFHNVHEILWDQHVYLYQPVLTTKNRMNWFWAKNEKVKKKEEEPII